MALFGSLAPPDVGAEPADPTALPPWTLDQIRQRINPVRPLAEVPPALRTTMPPEPVQELMKGAVEPLTTAGWMLGGAMQGTERPSPVDVMKAAGGLALGLTPVGPAEAGAASRAARAGVRVLEPSHSDILAGMAGKSFKDFSPQEWGAYGRLHHVPNLGPTSNAEFEQSLMPITTQSGREVTIPGGTNTKEPFTYYDLLHLKSQGINPNDLDPAAHHAIHTRMVNTMQPKDLSPEDIFNQLVFSMTSPANPLTSNEFTTSRIMARSPQDLDWIGNLIPWKHGDKTFEGKPIVAQARHAKEGEDYILRTGPGSYSDHVANAFGVQAGEEGGLGVRGNADYTRIAELAQMIREKPEFFRFKGEGEGGASPSENWARFVSRISSQVPGFAAKTGSFGTVWQSPLDAAISAIDRHMAGHLEAGIFENPKERAAWTKSILDEFNKGKFKQDQVKSIPEMIDAGGKTLYSDRMLEYLGKHPAANMRTPSGEYGKGVPDWMKSVDWVREPEQITYPSQAYVRALEASQPGAAANQQGLFSNQWMVWDRIRNRLEPHEVMFPGLNKLPPMNMEQVKSALDAHKALGYARNQGGVGSTPNPSSLGYFQIPLTAGAGAALGAGALQQPPPNQ